MLLSVAGSTPLVAFSVAATSAQTYFDERVRFHYTLTNEGGGYDDVWHEFICPLDGYYMFTVNGRTSTNGRIHMYMRMDGQVIGSAHAWSAAGVDDSGGNVVITHCNLGQAVWVDGHSTIESQLYGSSYRYSTFSGILLRSDDPGSLHEN